MRRKIILRTIPGFVPALLTLFLICCPHAHAATESKPAKKGPGLSDSISNSQSPIYVTADRMEANQEDKTIIFESHVVVKQDDVTITSNRLKVVLIQGEAKPEDKPPKSGAKTADNSPAAEKIDYIEFEGDVKVIQQDRVATANKAIFYQKEQKVVLHGHPVVTQGQNKVEGNLITVYLKESRSVVESGSDGPVKGIIYPGKKE